MKNKLLYYSLAFFIFSVCSCSCDKNGDGDPNNGNWTIPQEVKDYTLFKPGTYWIYEDSATGVLDSVYVYDLQTGIDSTTSGNFEYYYTYCMHDIDEYTDVMYVHTKWTKQWGTTTVWKSRFKPGVLETPQNFLMVYPFVPNHNYYCYTSYGVHTYIRSFDSYSILGHDYTNVAVFHDTKNNTENNSATNYYFSKNIGLIRKEIVDSSKVWNLLRFNIIQ